MKNISSDKSKWNIWFFWVTRDGVKPTDKIIEVIKNIKSPTSQKEVLQFIGVVDYYCNIWERCSHTPAPLTKITPSKVKFKWTKIEQDDFD